MKAIAPLLLPNGYKQIIKTFGNINNYIVLAPDGSEKLRPEFEKENILKLALPYPIRLANSSNGNVRTIKCHKLLKDRLGSIFDDIEKRGLANKITTFGGCFHFRRKRLGRDLSAHSWGIAIDLNPEANKQGNVGDMDDGIIEIFKKYEFVWGGDWSGRSRDPMHFQYCKTR